MNISKNQLVKLSLASVTIILGFTILFTTVFGMTESTGVTKLRFSDVPPKEEQVLEAMNFMTHQKIDANDKWGYILMSEENIETVKATINNSQFNNENILNAIIEKWENNNFSAIDKDHNIILELQNGTIGEATDILTPEQEQKLIDKKF